MVLLVLFAHKVLHYDLTVIIIGTYSLAIATVCSNCTAGTYSLQTGSTFCPACDAGKIFEHLICYM